jgi:hypothetical protein
MYDFPVLELHDINVVRLSGLTGRWTGTIREVRTRKDAVGAYIVAFSISGKRFQLVSAIRQRRHQPFHPLGIFP